MIVKTLALAAAARVVATAAQAHSHKLKKLEIVHPWCIETNDTAKPVVVFMTIKNAGSKPDRLLRAAASIAGKDRAARGARPTRKACVIASIPVGRGEVNLKRGGPHILLTGVKKQLGAYDSFLMTLTFERAGKVEVEVMVEEASVLAPAKK